MWCSLYAYIYLNVCAACLNVQIIGTTRKAMCSTASPWRRQCQWGAEQGWTGNSWATSRMKTWDMERRCSTCLHTVQYVCVHTYIWSLTFMQQSSKQRRLLYKNLCVLFSANRTFHHTAVECHCLAQKFCCHTETIPSFWQTLTLRVWVTAFTTLSLCLMLL